MKYTNFHIYKKNSKGIVALLPILVISGILIFSCLIISTSFLAFLFRVQIFEFKIDSVMAANACVSRVLSKFNVDNSYRGGERVMIGEVLCEIWPMEALNDPTVLDGKVSAKIGEAKTVKAFTVDNI